MSDEGRTVECLAPNGHGYAIKGQLWLDELFPSLPEGEADLESIEFDGKYLWLCGSHCRVRSKPEAANTLNAQIKGRPSRRLLARLTLKNDTVVEARALPFKGAGSLRRHLAASEYLAPFIELPSKEGGLDIEGFAVANRRAYFGLRGPVLDSFAVVVESKLAPSRKRGLALERLRLHFLDLDGLGIRDLTRTNEGLIVLAGPIAGTANPFRLHLWKPSAAAHVQKPQCIHEWPSTNVEHPEGVCVMERNGKRGLMVLYDSPKKSRVREKRYEADWFAVEGGRIRRT